MSDEIKFNCFKCGQHISAPASMKGELVDCPNCGEVNEVRGPSAWEIAPVEAIVEPPPAASPPPSPPVTLPALRTPDVILTAQKPPQVMVRAGYTTAFLAGVVASVPFLGWLVAVPLGIAAVIMAAILIARDRIASGVTLLLFSFVGIPFIGLIGTALFLDAFTPIATTNHNTAGRLAAVAEINEEAAEVRASSRWAREVSTNRVDDVVSHAAGLTAADSTGVDFGKKPVLVVRRRSNRQGSEIYIDFDRTIDSDDDERSRATGRIRWNEEAPISVAFALADSRDAVFVPEGMHARFFQNLTAGSQLIVEVRGFRGTMTATFNPPSEAPLPARR